jgi:hypothetical protein
VNSHAKLNALVAARVSRDYCGELKAPERDDAPLHDLTANDTYPSDVYAPDGARMYGGSAATWAVIRSARGRPNEWGYAPAEKVP